MFWQFFEWIHITYKDVYLIYQFLNSISLKLCAVFTLLRWQETYTEIAGMQRFGAFYMDYLYTMENTSGKGIDVFVCLP